VNGGMEGNGRVSERFGARGAMGIMIIIMAFCGSHISEASFDSPKAIKHSLSCKIGRNNPS